jgi:hypothetical protein
MNTYHFQISPYGYRTPWPLVVHRTRRFKKQEQAVSLAIRAAKIYKAEVRLTTGKHPLQDSGTYYRSPTIR